MITGSKTAYGVRRRGNAVHVWCARYTHRENTFTFRSSTSAKQFEAMLKSALTKGTAKDINILVSSVLDRIEKGQRILRCVKLARGRVARLKARAEMGAHMHRSQEGLAKLERQLREHDKSTKL